MTRTQTALVGLPLMVIALAIVLTAAAPMNATQTACHISLMQQSCVFTNDNYLMPASSCVYVKIVNRITERSAISNHTCSGVLWPRTTAGIPVVFPDNLGSMCSKMEDCGMEIVADSGTESAAGGRPRADLSTNVGQAVEPRDQKANCTYSKDGVLITCK